MLINHFLELLDLYPILVTNHSYLNISDNPNLTIDYAIEHFYDLLLRGRAIYNNPSISTPSNVANPKYQKVPWKYPWVLCSSSFSENDVLKYFENHNYDQDLIDDLLIHNTNITHRFFDTIRQQPVCYWQYLAQNEHFIEELCNGLKNNKIHPQYYSLFNHKLFQHRKLTIPMFRQLYDQEDSSFGSHYVANNPNVLQQDLNHLSCYHYEWYSQNINATVSTNLKHRCFTTPGIANNPNVLFEDLLLLLTNKSYRIRQNTIRTYSSNHNLTWEDVCDFSWNDWNWDGITNNHFTKSKKYYRETKLMRELFDTFDLEYSYLDLVQLL